MFIRQTFSKHFQAVFRLSPHLPRHAMAFKGTYWLFQGMPNIVCVFHAVKGNSRLCHELPCNAHVILFYVHGNASYFTWQSMESCLSLAVLRNGKLITLYIYFDQLKTGRKNAFLCAVKKTYKYARSILKNIRTEQKYFIPKCTCMDFLAAVDIKTNKMTCAPNEGSYQPGHLH